MARYAIDAVTLLHLVSQAGRINPGHQVVAPNSVRSDALALLLADVAAGRRSESEALELHEAMTASKVRLLGDRVSRRTAWKIARDHGWPSLREAEYLAIACLQADALVTVDPDLARKAEGVVPIKDVGVLTG